MSEAERVNMSETKQPSVPWPFSRRAKIVSGIIGIFLVAITGLNTQFSYDWKLSVSLGFAFGIPWALYGNYSYRRYREFYVRSLADPKTEIKRTWRGEFFFLLYILYVYTWSILSHQGSPSPTSFATASLVSSGLSVIMISDLLFNHRAYESIRKDALALWLETAAKSESPEAYKQ